MSGGRTSHARALTALLGALLLLALAAPAWADDGGAEAKPADGTATTERVATVEDLERRLLDNQGARWAIILGRVLPIVLGLVLLVLWYLERDKIRGGVLPPKPDAEPTLAFSLGEAVLWSLAALQLGPYLIVMLVAGGKDLKTVGMEPQLLALAGCEIAVAVLLLLRRQRMQLSTPAEREARLRGRVPAPTPPPGWGRAAGLGMWTYCVASLLVVPAMLLAAPLLHALDVRLEVQEPVRQVIQDGPSHLPLLMAVFGVLVAPFGEEAIFRGMLYPAVKRVMGGGTRGTWGAAVLVSLLFAAVHGSPYAFLPLFALAMVLTWIFETTNSLAAVMFAHALHNGITMVPLLLYRFS